MKWFWVISQGYAIKANSLRLMSSSTISRNLGKKRKWYADAYHFPVFTTHQKFTVHYLVHLFASFCDSLDKLPFVQIIFSSCVSKCWEWKTDYNVTGNFLSIMKSRSPTAIYVPEPKLPWDLFDKGCFLLNLLITTLWDFQHLMVSEYSSI